MKKRTWIALLPTGLLAACALEPRHIEAPQTQVMVKPARPSEVEQLLGHVAKVRALETREFITERESARSQVLQDKSDFNRIKYALVLALAPTASTSPALAGQDDVELLSLIEPLISAGSGSTSTDSEVRALATLLHCVVSERRKVREQLRDTQSRLTIARKDDTREEEARALRARVEELETKLNALKSIDRSVNRRAEIVRK
jgi:chromosome segregation ATPase